MSKLYLVLLKVLFQGFILEQAEELMKMVQKKSIIFQATSVITGIV